MKPKIKLQLYTKYKRIRKTKLVGDNGMKGDKSHSFEFIYFFELENW